MKGTAIFNRDLASEANMSNENSENPTEFIESKSFDGHTVELLDTCETSMGGARIGRLFIDGKKIRGNFGGPFFGKGDMLYIPKLRLKIFEGRNFDLFVFNLSTGKSRCVVMNSTGFGVLDADEKSLTMISGLGSSSVWKLQFVW